MIFSAKIYVYTYFGSAVGQKCIELGLRSKNATKGTKALKGKFTPEKGFLKLLYFVRGLKMMKNKKNAGQKLVPFPRY